VWIISCGLAAPGCADPAQDAAAAAKLLGWKTTVLDAGFGANNGFNTTVSQAVAAHANAIVMGAIDCSQSEQPLVAAAAAHIKIIFMESFNNCTTAKIPAVPLIYSKANPTPGDFFAEWGQLRAEYIVGKTGGHAQVLWVNQTDNQEGRGETGGFVSVMNKSPGISVVDVPWVAQDNGSVLQTKFQAALVANPNATVVATPYDAQFTESGFASSIVASGRANSILAVGGEGYAADVAFIRGGDGQNAGIADSQQWIGFAAIDELNRAFAGQPSVPEGLGFAAIDKQHGLPPVGKDYEPPVNFESAYKKLWGVKG
jgi:ribose transport system substrate-binding protein